MNAVMTNCFWEDNAVPETFNKTNDKYCFQFVNILKYNIIDY